MERKEFEESYKKFLETLETCKDEFWTSEKNFAEEIFERFVSWCWQEDIEKEQRYQQYLKLKEEFDNE